MFVLEVRVQYTIERLITILCHYCAMLVAMLPLCKPRLYVETCPMFVLQLFTQCISLIVDVDECRTNNGSCHGCLNTIGSYECICQSGFQVFEYEDGVNKTCVGKRVCSLQY